MSVTIQAAKQGYYARTLPLTLTAGENRCPLTLPRLPTNNLLDNGDFEKGFPAARSMEHGTTGKRGAWSFRFSPGVGCYIYPESIYGWRKPHIFRGKEAISHVTDGGGEIQLSQDVVVDPNATLTGFGLGARARRAGQWPGLRGRASGFCRLLDPGTGCSRGDRQAARESRDWQSHLRLPASKANLYHDTKDRQGSFCPQERDSVQLAARSGPL